MKPVNYSITELTVQIARIMGFPEEEIRYVRRGVILHDIGELGVPLSVLEKPGPLTERERSQMMRHPQIAYNLMSSVGYLRPSVDIPYCHHEKWDGSGYPRGLRGKQIPLAARIFAVVDVWDAIRSERPHSPGWPDEVALNYIKRETGRHFDPEVVRIFFGILNRRRNYSPQKAEGQGANKPTKNCTRRRLKG